MTSMTCLEHRAADDNLASEEGLRRATLAYGPDLRAYATRKLGSCVADDLVQETFLRAWRSAERFDTARGTTRAWLFAILRNVVIDFARRQARRPSVPIAEVDRATNDETDAVVSTVAVHDALRRLTAQQREIIYHGHLRERTHVEIAQLLGVPTGTVRSRLHYARQALKRVLVEAG